MISILIKDYHLYFYNLQFSTFNSKSLQYIRRHEGQNSLLCNKTSTPHVFYLGAKSSLILKSSIKFINRWCSKFLFHVKTDKHKLHFKVSMILLFSILETIKYKSSQILDAISLWKPIFNIAFKL